MTQFTTIDAPKEYAKVALSRKLTTSKDGKNFYETMAIWRIDESNTYKFRFDCNSEYIYNFRNESESVRLDKMSKSYTIEH